jgi:transketolase
LKGKRLETDLKPNQLETLNRTANQIRRKVLDMVYKARSGHLGGSFSAVEIITSLYFSEMRIDPANIKWEDRDRLVPSKGHCAPALYAAMAMRGLIDPVELDDLRQAGCMLQGHPCMKKIPGIDISTGSLGHGLSIGLGMALGARLRGRPFNVYVLLGDGELNEGQIWEAAMAASKLRLSNLIALVDRNCVQLDGKTEDIMPMEPLAEKWEAFNWGVKTVDGHDPADVISGIRWAKSRKDGPSVIIARTVKGKGVSFMENTHVWHGRPPDPKEYAAAVSELSGGRDA